jgi:hypothetical protein
MDAFILNYNLITELHIILILKIYYYLSFYLKIDFFFLGTIFYIIFIK